MKRLSQAAILTVTAGAAVLGSAGGAFAAVHGAGAEGAAVGSPGVISGNLIQVPVDVPINLCGNTIDIVGLLNPALGNTCVSR